MVDVDKQEIFKVYDRLIGGKPGEKGLELENDEKAKEIEQSQTEKYETDVRIVKRTNNSLGDYYRKSTSSNTLGTLCSRKPWEAT